MPAAITNSPAGFALFATAIGRCALVWRVGRIVGVALPEASDERMRERLAKRFPDAREAPPPEFAVEAMSRIASLLDGEDADLEEIEIDLGQASDFDRSVYLAARAIPRGRVRSYGELAREIGQPQAAQAVGVALGRNPVPIIIPCHRVLASGGRSGGFSAPGGLATKFRILEIEGARRSTEPELFETLPLAIKPHAPPQP